MIAFLKGQIINVSGDYITVCIGQIGYEVLVSRPQEFEYMKEYSIYTQEIQNQDDHYLVGFLTTLEKDAFRSLIQVKGIGPKTAMNALKETTPDGLFAAIAANNTAYLKKLPGIGDKAAKQIILDLKGHLTTDAINVNEKQYDEVSDALKSLGFKKKEIEAVLSSINEPNLSNAELIKLALRKLNKGTK